MMTIRTFQALHEISESGLEPIDKSIEMVKVFTGYSQQQIEKMKAAKFNRLCGVITKELNRWTDNTIAGNPKKVIYVKGKPYRMNYDIFLMTGSKYVEAVTFAKEPVKELHKLLATMVTPLRMTWKGLQPMAYPSEDHPKISELMLDAEYGDIYHALVFFYAVSKESLINLATYGKGEEKAAALLLRHSLSYGDGFIKPNWYRNLKGLA